MDAIEVRPATERDVQAVQSVGLLTWPPTYLPFTSPDFVLEGLQAWWSADVVRATITRDATFVAEVGGRVVGTATLGVLGDDAVIWRLYVIPLHHGAGVGRALMEAMLAHAPHDEAVRVEFIEGNDRARAFYGRAGFAFERIDRAGSGPATVWYRRSPSSAS